jgi:hypothetical protein
MNNQYNFLKWVFHVGKISTSLVECQNLCRKILEEGDEDYVKIERINDKLNEILEHINL